METYQNGTVIKRERTKGPDVWAFRYRQRDLQGNVRYVSEIFSDVRECPTKAAAEKKVLPLRKRINEQRVCATFGDLADRYEAEDLPTNPHTRQGYLGNLQHLRAKWNKERLDSIIANIMGVQLWINTLKDKYGNEYSKQTRQHIRNLMHKIFEDGILWGLLPIQRNPIDLVRVKQGARKKRRNLILSAEQIDTLLRDPLLIACVKAIIMIAACTGMRISEILGLRWDDIDFANGFIAILRRADGNNIAQTKSPESEQEKYPMHPILAGALKEWRKAAEPIEGWLFGSALTGRPFHARSLAKCHLRPAGKRAGIQGLGWHTFRHTYRALLADLEQPLDVQQALMRHSDVGMTLEYGKFSAKRTERLRQANDKVVKLVAG